MIVAPEVVGDAAANLASLGSSISDAHAAAAAPTTGILAAGADEVSSAVTSLFSGYASQFQAASAQASAFHSEFVQTLHASAGSYTATEAANIAALRPSGATSVAALPNPIGAILNQLVGRPLNLALNVITLPFRISLLIAFAVLYLTVFLITIFVLNFGPYF
jgi:PE family